MALQTTFAFAAGVVVGWVGRSALGSSREALVRALALSHGARERVKRALAEQREWVEDLVAEGRARYEQQRGETVIEHDVPPKVVDVRKRRGRAA
jgi:hypothetical protein